MSPSPMQDDCLDGFHSSECPQCGESREAVNVALLREITVFLSHLAEMGDSCVIDNCEHANRLSEAVGEFMESNGL
jgi:uncharacterized protein (UPF0212 family)